MEIYVVSEETVFIGTGNCGRTTHGILGLFEKHEAARAFIEKMSEFEVESFTNKKKVIDEENTIVINSYNNERPYRIHRWVIGEYPLNGLLGGES